MSIITMVTDFGLQDAYVGTMKGTILGIHPTATIVDITHGVNPQNVVQAAFMIKSAYTYFPEGSVHLVVVDPGVGGNRSIIALAMNGHMFLGPDNGILMPVMEQGNVDSLVSVDNSHLFLHPVSQTFHGRDIFAPLAAYLAKGISRDQLGPEIDKSDLISLNYQSPHVSRHNKLVGVIVSIDHFGNLITDIHVRDLATRTVGVSNKKMIVTVGDRKIKGLSETYSTAGMHHPLALIGSNGYLEIAVNCGNAQSYFQATWGDRIVIG